MSKSKLTQEEREAKAREEIEHRSKYEALANQIPMKHYIYNDDSSNMYQLKDGSVELIVTSPPYFNAKEYSTFKSLEKYYDEMKKVFKECYRVLKPGRRFCLNISDLPTKGDSGIKWLSLGAGLLKVCEDIGFELADRVFWFKTPLKGFQYGSLPFPPSPLICDSMEYVYILRKPTKRKPDYSKIDPVLKEASKLTRDEYGLYTQQVWSIRRVRIKDNEDGHIAPFPEELPLRCIRLYSFAGETVLDPFGGSGTTGVVAMKYKRNSVQYEIKKEYADMIYNNMINSQGIFINDEVIYDKKED